MNLARTAVAAIALSTAAAVSAPAWSAACGLADVSIEGRNATQCKGLFEGNNPPGDAALNALFGTPFTDWIKDDNGPLADPLGAEVAFAQGSFAFEDIFGDAVVVILKQATSWGAYLFDLTGLGNGGDGYMNGSWSAASGGWQHDLGCKLNKKGVLTGPCGGLSHGMVGGTIPDTSVPAPGTISLLALGLIGLVLVRRRQAVAAVGL